MMHLLGAAYLGFISGAGIATVAISAMREGRREDQRARERLADALRREVQGVAVHSHSATPKEARHHV